MAKTSRVLDDEEDNKPTEVQRAEGPSTSKAHPSSNPPTTSNNSTGSPRRQQTKSSDVGEDDQDTAGDESLARRSSSWRPSPRALSADERAEAKEAYLMFDLEATGKLRLRPLKMAFRALGIKVHTHTLCSDVGGAAWCCSLALEARA